jgi:tetratricopeptide (TPR) repeat protein
VLVSIKQVFTRVFTATALCAALWAQEAPKPSGEPQWKDRAEYDLVQSISAEQDANKKLTLLNQWKEKYPGTDFKKIRASLYLQTYQQLNQPQNIMTAAKDVLAIDPKDVFALSMISYFTPVLTNTSPDALDMGEKAAQGVLSQLDATFAADKKPAQVTAEQWAQNRKLAEAQSHKTLGWVAMVRKNAPTAQEHFLKSLESNPAQGDVSYWLGQTIMGEKKVEKYPTGLWHVARAASYDGPGALPPQGRTAVDDYLKKAYTGYHGDLAGLDQLKAQTKNTALPPAGFHIKSVTEIAQEKLKQEEEFIANNPMLGLWKRIRDELNGENGQAYFDSSMKDAAIPKLRGWVVEQRPKELLVAISDKQTPEVTLQLDAPITAKVEPGTEIQFEGIGKSFTKEPFMVVMDVERKAISGLPAAAPARKPARRRR